MPARPPACLCDRCAEQRIVRTTRGSEFSLCARSKRDPAFARYPPLPVVRCRGFTPRPEGAAAPPATGGGEGAGGG